MALSRMGLLPLHRPPTLPFLFRRTPLHSATHVSHQSVGTRKFRAVKVLAGASLLLGSPFIFSPDLRRFSRAILCAATVTLDYKWTLWGVDEEDPKYELLNKVLHQRSANRALQLAFTNGGLYIKAGQYLASLNHLLPKEYLDTLSVLQDQAPSQPYEMVERIFWKDFGHPVEYFFKEFDKEPLAAASVAQVHRAVTHDGQEMAVKVQFEQLEREFNGDMFTQSVLLRLLSMAFPGFDFADFAGDDMRKLLAAELDFVNEAQNSIRASENICGEGASRKAKLEAEAYVPEVYWPCTSKRVLSTEFIHGCKINDLKRIREYGLSPEKVVSSMLKVFSEQIFISGFVHADPHPGNVFVRPHPIKKGKHQIVILDHGLYNEIENETRIAYCGVWKAMVCKDNKALQHFCKQLGVEGEDRCRIFAQMVLMRGYSDSTPAGLGDLLTKEDMEEMAEHVRNMMGEVVELLKAMPKSLLLVLRNNNLLRASHQELNVPVNRFTVMARCAARGLTYSEKAAVGKSSFVQQVKAYKETMLFETKLSLFRLTSWLTDLYIFAFIKIHALIYRKLPDMQMMVAAS